MPFQNISRSGECFMGRFALSNARPVTSYRLRFASYVRARSQADEMPEQFRRCVLLVRSFDRDAILVADEVVEGRKVESVIERQLADPRTAYLRIHCAPGGRYVARVERH